MQTYRTLITAALLVASTSLSLTAQQRLWVDASLGDDNNPGTATQPLKSITRGLALATAGARVFVRQGTYGPTATGEVLPLELGVSAAQQNVTILGLKNPRLDFESQGGAGWRIGAQADGGRISGFTFTGGDTTSWWTRVIEAGSYGGAATATGFEIDRCVFDGVNRGIVLWATTAPAQGWSIHNNLFTGLCNDGIDDYGAGSQLEVFNNTLVGGKTLGIVSDAPGTRVRNNIVTGHRVGINTLNPANPARFLANDVWSNGKDWDGIAAPPGNFNVDPLFADPTGGDYRLQAQSPMLEQGAAVAARADLDLNPGAVDGDRDGVVRPDVGAYELSTIRLSGYDIGSKVVLGLDGTRTLDYVCVTFALQDGVFRIPGQSPILLDPATVLPVVLCGFEPFHVQVPLAMQPAPGTRLLAQAIVIPRGGGAWVASNQVAPFETDPVPGAVVETFDSSLKHDTARSAGAWGGGVAVPGLLGHDGLHGDFDPTFGRAAGLNTWVFSTDNQVIPGSTTLSGQPEIIGDGVFRFATLELPAGVTVRFEGRNQARIFVRGDARVDGALSVDAAKPAPYRNTATFGQPPSPGGAGGGSGGRGATPGDGNGNEPQFHGGDGEDVRLLAGHAYAANTPGTGGRGSLQFPLSGLNSAVTYTGVSNQFSEQLAAGGGGGGFTSAGTAGMAIRTTNNTPGTLGPPAPGGVLFNLFPIPPSAIDHFLVGGGGGGGGGSHPFFSLKPQPQWRPGATGAGGGGVLALRTGRDLQVGAAAVLSARGGDGARQQSPPPAPGGGGAGGSVVLQVGGALAQLGSIELIGGNGGVALDNTIYFVEIRGGDGGHGQARLEQPGGAQVSGLGAVNPPSGASSAGALLGRDQVTGDQSLWYTSGSTTPPVWLRYELEATVGGARITYSDDPAVGPRATAGQAVQFFIQGADVEPISQMPLLSTSISPWRSQVGRFVPGAPALADDGANGYRFALVYDASVSQQVTVDKVTVHFER